MGIFGRQHFLLRKKLSRNSEVKMYKIKVGTTKECCLNGNIWLSHLAIEVPDDD